MIIDKGGYMVEIKQDGGYFTISGKDKCSGIINCGDTCDDTSKGKKDALDIIDLMKMYLLSLDSE